MSILRLAVSIIVAIFVLVFFKEPDSAINQPADQVLTKAEISTKEPPRNILTNRIIDSDTVLQLEIDQEINYFSVEDVFKATNKAALRMLEMYKYHESNAESSIESQFRLYLIGQECLLTRTHIETQADLDSMLLNLYPASGTENAVRKKMQTTGLCRELVRYVGNDSFHLVDEALKIAANKGHPIAKLISANRGLTQVTSKERLKLFRQAFEYSRTDPEHRRQVYKSAADYLLALDIMLKSRGQEDQSSLSFNRLTLTLITQEALFANNELYAEKSAENLLDKLNELFLPTEIDQILAWKAYILNATENGDWSFLGLTDDEESEA